MAIATKADFYAWYSVCPRDPVTSRRYTEIRLHYHPANVPILGFDGRLDKILAKYPLVATDSVLVFGAGFGWLCEKIIERIGCLCIGIDTSEYIHLNKDLSPDDELQESIEAAGLGITDGALGQEIWEKFKQMAPRTTAILLQEDLLSQPSMNAVKKALENKWPTHIITEEVWQLLSDTEKTDLQAAFDSIGATIIHVIDGVVI